VVSIRSNIALGMFSGGGSQLEKPARDVYPSKAAESVITGPMDVVVAAALWNSVCIWA
jgi:hypothetical protein